MPPTECAVARAAVSARLDGQLPEVDGMRLDRHLLACSDCSAYAREIVALAGWLRAADLEQPGTRIFTPQRRRRPLLRLQGAAAAVALVAVATGSSFVLGRTFGSFHTPAPVILIGRSSGALGLRQDSVQQHLLAMLSRLGSSRSHGTGRVIAL